MKTEIGLYMMYLIHRIYRTNVPPMIEKNMYSGYNGRRYETAIG